MKARRALISLSDKAGLEKLVKGLNELGIEIMSTGGTAQKISSFGVPVVDVSSYTGFPEMLDGRVKTLHPKIHGGLLALRDNEEHMRVLEEHEILPIDIVVVNLYPFEQTIMKDGVTFEEAIENIDIGGPTMLRSAAKNLKHVAVVSSPMQYDALLKELEENNCELSDKTLQQFAAEVFARTSQYDSLIADYLKENSEKRDTKNEIRDTNLSGEVSVELKKVQDLRYGENPHQKAAFYRDVNSKDIGVADATKLQGKELSFNNIMDINAALEMVKDFDTPAVSIVKHSNPCGIATADDLEKAYRDALDCDRLSAFGSIMGFNRPISRHMAGVILKEVDFVECIIAPEYDEEALEVFSAKKNLRILRLPVSKALDSDEKDMKKVVGGVLIQDLDNKDISIDDLKVVTDKKPSEDLMEAALFGWKVVKHVKSNAIVLCKGTKSVGIGAGQMSRVDSVIISIRKAGERARGAILASDAFFPKADSIEEAAKAGIAAIIQPGGSIRDQEVIDACNRLDMPMILTGARHFKH